MKYWEILLTKQRERGKDGLTLPFLIGSQKYLPTTHVRQNIADLIHDIVSSNTFEICIRYCMGTATLVFEIRKHENYCYYPTYNGRDQNRLSIGISLKDLGGNIEMSIERLKEKFQAAIDKELFSAESNIYERTAIWQPFSNEDIVFIENSFMAVYSSQTDTNKGPY